MPRRKDDTGTEIKHKLQKLRCRKKTRVNTFDPGMVPGTGLARTYPPVLRFVWNNVMPILTNFKPNTNCAKKSGKRLANLALNEQQRPVSGIYYSDGKLTKSSISPTITLTKLNCGNQILN